MDPDTTLQGLLDALGQRDWDRVDELSQALLDWLKQGGFPPLTLGPKELGKQLHHTVTYFTCYAALARSREARKQRQRRQERQKGGE